MSLSTGFCVFMTFCRFITIFSSGSKVYLSLHSPCNINLVFGYYNLTRCELFRDVNQSRAVCLLK
jgi:hypothetical protein